MKNFYKNLFTKSLSVTPNKANFVAWVVALFCTSLFPSNLAHAQEIPSIKDFEGFELSFYNESSGNRYLKLDYHKALTEKPKLGFLKFGLSFLKVEDLSIYLDARFAQPDLVSDLFTKLTRCRGIRYAVAEPISLAIHTKEGRIHIRAEKGKFTADHSLNIWGEVVCKQNSHSQSFEKLTISLDPFSNHMSIKSTGDNPTLHIPIPQQS